MANYTDLMSLFDDIGDAINDKGVSGQFYPNQMATAIRSIPDFTPSGNFAITANGIYDVTDYATASVNITTGVDHGVFITEEDDPAGGKIMYVTGVDLSQDTVDAAHLVSGYTAHDRSGNAITGTFGGVELNNQSKSITPSTSQQIVSPDSGYTGLSSVTVAAIPSQFKNTSDADAVAANILYDKTAYNSTGKITGTMPNNGATGGTISTQNGTYTIPAGYTSGGIVTATLPTQTLPTSAAASATSEYTSKATISRSTSDQYINIPTGYNSAGAYYKINAVANGSATGPSSVSGTSASVSTGTNTLTLTKTGVSTTPTVSAGYVSSATASTATVTLTANITTKAATTITPSTTNQTIASGTYLTGTQTISGDANLIGANIKAGVSIFGVPGTYAITSKNVQIDNTIGRATSSTYTAVGPSITVSKTGTYDIYWWGYRSSTSGTSGSQLYIGDSSYGTTQTSFDSSLTNIQKIHLTNVSLTQNNVLTIRARSRGNNYYMYIMGLVIQEV